MKKYYWILVGIAVGLLIYLADKYFFNLISDKVGRMLLGAPNSLLY